MAWKHRASARSHPLTACAMSIKITEDRIFQRFAKDHNFIIQTAAEVLRGQPFITHLPCGMDKLQP